MAQKSFILSSVIALTISITVSFAIVYTHVQYFTPANPGGNFDASKYISVYDGKEIEGHWRFRPLTPFLARILPDPPHWLFSKHRDITDLWIAKIKFGAVNLFFLTATGVVLFWFLGAFGLSLFESLVGMLLFYTARPVLQSAGTPTADAAFYCFLLVCLYALYRQNLFLLVAGFSMGIFAKEAMFLVFPALLLSQMKRKTLVCTLLIPSTLAYFFFRFYLYPDSAERYFNLVYLFRFTQQIFSLVHCNVLLDLFSSFGLLWAFALYALFYSGTPVLLKRWSWLVLLILGMIVFLGGNFGRIAFKAFPIVIPLALYGIRALLAQSARHRVPSHPTG